MTNISAASTAGQDEVHPIFLGQLGWALKNSLFVAKAHEAQSALVEQDMRTAFPGQLLWVLPYAQVNKQNQPYPCLRIIDGSVLETPLFIETGDPKNPLIDTPLTAKAKEIFPRHYGIDEVYVSTESRTIGNEGDALKYVVDHLLALRYGHKDYMVEFNRTNRRSKHASILIEDYSDIENMARIPQDVVSFVFAKAQEFRPELAFRLDSKTIVVNQSPRVQHGFNPVLFKP